MWGKDWVLPVLLILSAVGEFKCRAGQRLIYDLYSMKYESVGATYLSMRSAK